MSYLLTARYPNGIKYKPYAYTMHGLWSMKGYLLKSAGSTTPAKAGSIVADSVATKPAMCRSASCGC